jgi:hypothetical protein
VLAEVVVSAVLPGPQGDVADFVVTGERAANAADVLIAVEVPGRLQLNDRVGTRAEVGELVLALSVRCRLRDDVPLRVFELDRHTGQRPHAGRTFDAIAVAIGDVDAAADR